MLIRLIVRNYFQGGTYVTHHWCLFTIAIIEDITLKNLDGALDDSVNWFTYVDLKGTVI